MKISLAISLQRYAPDSIVNIVFYIIGRTQQLKWIILKKTIITL